MADLLLELFSEEIPARMQRQASEDLKRLVGEALKAAGLTYAQEVTYVTPRRLALSLHGLPEQQPDVTDERKGPRVGSPQGAVDGFLKATGLADIAKAEQRDTGKGIYYFAKIARKGRPTIDVLQEILPNAIKALPWPKSMLWGAHALRWVRPLHRILCIFNGRTVPFVLDHLTADNITEGHRFMSGNPFEISAVREYPDVLERHKVLAEFHHRRSKIGEELKRLATDKGLRLRKDDALLDEVTGLVEWPVVMMGRIDQTYLSLPAPILTTAMRTHQKYFAFEDAEGALAPWFGFVANMEAADGGKQIIAGNERVLRARLSDAQFFWEQDLKTPLESLLPKLKDVVFHAKLGSVYDKATRMAELAQDLAQKICGRSGDAKDKNFPKISEAARLAKADLMTGTVGEFPELQGEVGYFIACETFPKEEAQDIAEAIRDHYAPKGLNDDCPRSAYGVFTALADKIDTLVGFFAIGETPTGSKDPFALRRAALGVIRIIEEQKLRLNLAEIFSSHFRRYDTGADPTQALMAFFIDRLKVYLRDQGKRHDLVAAVLQGNWGNDIFRLMGRVQTLTDFLATPDGGSLLAAYKRAANISRIEEKKDGVSYDAAPDEIFPEKEEKDLFKVAVILSAKARGMQDENSDSGFEDMCKMLAQSRSEVDVFFEKVTVNAEDPSLRINRLKLLSFLRRSVDQIADFSKIEG